jgi:fatty acid synthase subunit alpha, fungi type
VTSIFALFSGQGNNEVYFDELQSLYDIYKPYVAPLISTVTNEVLIPLVSAREATSFYFYAYGLQVLSLDLQSYISPLFPSLSLLSA